MRMRAIMTLFGAGWARAAIRTETGTLRSWQGREESPRHSYMGRKPQALVFCMELLEAPQTVYGIYHYFLFRNDFPHTK